MKTVRLHPWRDGIDHCLRLLEDVTATTAMERGSPPNNTTARNRTVASIRNGQYSFVPSHDNPIQTVDVCFHEQDLTTSTKYPTPQQLALLDELFGAIGRLPHLESLMVRYSSNLHSEQQSQPHKSSTRPILWISSLTALLANASQMKYLTLIGVPLVGDELDMNGFVESLRIHPGLISVAIRSCAFGNGKHEKQLQQAMSGVKQVDLGLNQVVDARTATRWVTEMDKSGKTEKPWWRRILCCGC
jgi:hypothetical protein